jgi:hypothetical protein
MGFWLNQTHLRRKRGANIFLILFSFFLDSGHNDEVNYATEEVALESTFVQLAPNSFVLCVH